jgi:DNA-binding NarL/FixJ family response regulator
VKTRVVVVDDMADIRCLVRAALNADGRFDVVGEAGDGRDAVNVVGLTRPDVVVLDLRMPTMDGLEAATEIAQVSAETKVVILSAVSEQAVAAATGETATMAYLNKGSSARAIVEAVASAASA